MAKGIYNKVGGVLHKWRYNNVFVNGYYDKKRKEILKPEVLSSKDFDALYLEHTSGETAFKKVLNDAEEMTENFKHRHLKMHKVLGCWRWKGLWQYRNQILPILFDPNKKGIDFGGSNGPVALHTDIVDFDPVDAFKRPVKYKHLTDVKYKADFLFSSHTLEHIDDLDSIFQDMLKVLKPGADIIFHVPAYSCVRWRSGLHTNRKFNDHKWTFYLEGTTLPEGLINPKAFDTAVAPYFEITHKSYVGDDSILLMGKCPNP